MVFSGITNARHQAFLGERPSGTGKRGVTPQA